MDKNLGFDSSEMDALAEVGNVGIGNATTALSKLLQKKIEIRLPETKFVPIAEFAQEVGGAENIVVTSYLQVTGDLNGEVVFVFPRKDAMQFIDILMGKEMGSTKIIESLDESAFKEMSNIFTGSYLNALTKMFDIKVFHSVPHVAIDMAQAIVDFVLIKLASTADKVLCVKTDIVIEGHDIDGTFMILFDEASLNFMVDSLKKRYGI